MVWRSVLLKEINRVLATLRSYDYLEERQWEVAVSSFMLPGREIRASVSVSTRAFVSMARLYQRAVDGRAASTVSAGGSL